MIAVRAAGASASTMIAATVTSKIIELALSRICKMEESQAKLNARTITLVCVGGAILYFDPLAILVGSLALLYLGFGVWKWHSMVRNFSTWDDTITHAIYFGPPDIIEPYLERLTGDERILLTDKILWSQRYPSPIGSQPLLLPLDKLFPDHNVQLLKAESIERMEGSSNHPEVIKIIAAQKKLSLKQELQVNENHMKQVLDQVIAEHTTKK
jgi:hypothetical protein